MLLARAVLRRGGVPRGTRAASRKALDAEERAQLRAKGAVRYETMTADEILERKYQAESRRLAAKEAARNMQQDDAPPPEFNSDDEL